MLNFPKLIGQIDHVGKDSLVNDICLSEVVAKAQDVYNRAKADADKFIEKLSTNCDTVLWPVSLPIETFGSTFDIDKSLGNVTVVACDGSQIMPSRHEVHNCYLINVGYAAISYGLNTPALLQSEPYLFHKGEDLYPLVNHRRLPVDEQYVSLERNYLELKAAADVALDLRSEKLPVVAMLDGSLIPWSLDKMPPTHVESYIKRVSAIFETLEKAKVPLIGYVSNSRSADVVNALRMWHCPYPSCKCSQFCGNLNEEDFPCSEIWPLSDRMLMASTLNPWQRSNMFASGSHLARLFGSGKNICFAYLNVQAEVARLEFPLWLSEDMQAFDLAMQVVCAQVQKGNGYPVLLAEAHNLAVIRGDERSKFYELITRHLIDLGVERVNVSPKELQKRRSIL
jgi:hypothetical protein